MKEIGDGGRICMCVQIGEDDVKMMMKQSIPKNSHGQFFFFFSYIVNQLNDKNVQLLIYPFELIKRRDTCHSKIISYTSYKRWTFYRILYLYFNIKIILSVTQCMLFGYVCHNILYDNYSFKNDI
ncbi:hypothetical protein HanRHA438_Chr17g0808351 [Helianthus annuus]|nr:hypothetical protein HanRHA438_Chr17g0808351 [Helianthus annuus]